MVVQQLAMLVFLADLGDALEFYRSCTGLLATTQSLVFGLVLVKRQSNRTLLVVVAELVVELVAELVAELVVEIVVGLAAVFVELVTTLVVVVDEREFELPIELFAEPIAGLLVDSFVEPVAGPTVVVAVAATIVVVEL